jgi:hypothetical protein
VIKKILLSFILLLTSMKVFSQEVSYIGRSPRAQLMGDAFTAVADDEYTMFYNPAALGRTKGITFTPINPSFGATNFLGDTDRFKNFPKSDPSAIADRILNYPVSFQASAFPGFKLGNFGFNLFATSKTNMVLRNAIHPSLDADYRYDRGFIAGYAYNIGTGATSKKLGKTSIVRVTPGSRVSFGVAVKHINREGMTGQYDLFGTTLLNTINSGATSITDLKKALGYSKGKAWGVDLGTEYAYSTGTGVFTAGFSILDVGSTRFTKTEGTGDVPIQDMTINSGIAYKKSYGLLDYTLAADIRPLNSSIDISRKFHLGAEVSIPLVSVNAGWSEGYLSYGATVKLFPFKLSAGFYGVELGSKFREQEAKRLIVYLSLFDFSFDL